MSNALTVNPFFGINRVAASVEINGERVDIGRDAIMRGDVVLGVVSPKYKLVTNSEVDGIFSEAFSGMDILFTKDHLDGTGSRWNREIVLNGDAFTRDMGNGDIVKTKINVRNGYTGKNDIGFDISAWRQICSNGMMGWRTMFGASFSHLENDIVEKIRNIFNVQFQNFGRNFDMWQDWTAESFSQNDFNRFIDFNTKENVLGNDKAYLSEGQADNLKELFSPTMNQYKENETKWGAYNVLTAIATHHTKAQKGSHLFSAGYGRMERLTNDFYNYNKPS